ncbi:MAG: hypothetical protein V3W41_17175 [Planctomycetota bacterium]
MAPAKKKRLIFAGLLGLLIALVAIWVFRHVYDPFADDVEDLALLLPQDIDFFVEIDDFPSFVRGLENREFFSRLDRNRDIQAFLSSPRVEETEFIPLLRNALREVNRAQSNPDIPLGLEVLGDLSGTQVVVGGYLPKNDGEDIKMMVCFKPESVKAIVAINAVLDETIFKFFVEDRLPDVEVVHRNWGAELTIVQDGKRQVWALARIENAVIIGNELDLVKRSVNRVRRDGILQVRPRRLEGRWVFEGASGATIRAAMSQGTAGEKVSIIDRFLAPLWGQDSASAFESIFPSFEGDDLRLGLEIDEVFTAKLAIESVARHRPSPFEEMTSLNVERVESQFEDVLEKLPHYVFGYGYISSRPGTLVSHLFNQPGLVDADKRALWFEELAKNMPRFADAPMGGDGVPDLVPRLQREFDTAFGRGVGFALFKKERDDGGENKEPGLALVLDVNDRTFIEELIQALGAIAGEDRRALEREEIDGDVFWRVANTSFLDDAENNRPGFALIGDHFVITNWYRLLEDYRAVSRRELASFGAVNAIRDGIDRSEDWTRGFFFLDSARLYAYMDDAKPGWIKERMVVSDEDTFAAARKFELEAERRRLPAEGRDLWIDQQVEVWLRNERQSRNEQAIAHEIDQYLDYFRAAFESVFISVGQVDDEVRIGLRLLASQL